MANQGRAKRPGRGFLTFGAGFVTGVSSLTSFGQPATLPRYPHQSPSAALGRDWARIGGDMKTVIEREQGHLEKKKK